MNYLWSASLPSSGAILTRLSSRISNRQISSDLFYWFVKHLWRDKNKDWKVKVENVWMTMKFSIEKKLCLGCFKTGLGFWAWGALKDACFWLEESKKHTTLTCQNSVAPLRCQSASRVRRILHQCGQHCGLQPC